MGHCEVKKIGLIVGTATWTVAIATAQSGGAPSGNYVYIFIDRAQGVRLKTKYKPTIIYLPSGKSVSIDIGERIQSFNFTGARIISGTFTDMNLYKDFFDDNSGSGSSPIYGFVMKNSVYANWRDENDANQQYLKGKIEGDVDFIDQEGKLTMSLKFAEASS